MLSPHFPEIAEVLHIENNLSNTAWSMVLTLLIDGLEQHTYGRIRADLEQNGMPIDPLDLQIAAIALTRHLTHVSHIIREFSRIPHLQLKDWETA
jgi:tRNA(fMet)-specific endonuclease VapC